MDADQIGWDEVSDLRRRLAAVMGERDQLSLRLDRERETTRAFKSRLALLVNPPSVLRREVMRLQDRIGQVCDLYW